MATETDLDHPYRAWGMTALVHGAHGGDELAWTEIVRRHTNLVLARIRQFRLAPEQAEDVAQTVWLNLLEHLGRIREPEALPGWIATATHRECIRTANLDRRSIPVDPQGGRLDGWVEMDLDEAMAQVERNGALRDGLAELPRHQRELLVLLASDPPLSYAEIAERLAIPIGSIGPTRARGLARLRRTTAIRDYVASYAEVTLGEGERSVLALG